MNADYEQLQIFRTAKILLSRLISSYSLRESENIVRILVEDISGYPYHVVKMDKALSFTQEQYDRWRDTTDKIADGQPLQYALGKAWFMDLELEISPKVLIPRPETEELAERVVKTMGIVSTDPRRLSTSPLPKLQILDIGTGSGCLAVYLAKAFPEAKILANDISRGALEIAEKNARLHKVTIELILLDILKAPREKFKGLDLIVSNPPYIPFAERSEMSDRILSFEPESALFVPDGDPLLFYRSIAISARGWLQPWGALLCEVHEDLAGETAQLLQSLGYRQVEIFKDLQDKERIVSAFLPS